MAVFFQQMTSVEFYMLLRVIAVFYLHVLDEKVPVTAENVAEVGWNIHLRRKYFNSIPFNSVYIKTFHS